ncbi:TPA: rod shape-determining protein MreC [Legionella pneumophila]|uniref:rod shape-determining protein MreC n=1 Tax=Legionella pneumophila TaxID=446 RepID=UPI000D0623E8|nr:rod shape-determining protein MreC [Legionella pneumophila]HAT1820595.1 rod shape-determining protein MreC [Legionella pneumophila]HAT1921924.1 rod shape-determining protein MreC [Legionella pneumophila]HAT7768441.1 rod shape-determining protein MreC [Legionella pneumophila]HAU1638630.1 rod shape-determining protein MreC [Legionella pneumophila]HAU1682966.1 rod shape-determining protein MreC [Legionella pneumophila]
MISSQQNNKHNRLFAKGGHSSLGFVFALVFSILLMFSDYHYRYLDFVRSGFSLIVSPLQYAVDYPVRVIGWVQSLVSAKKALIDENMRLKYKQTMLEAELQKLIVIQRENSQLKELLLTSSKADMRVMAAQILAVDTSQARQVVVLNKGTRDGVYVGQPVLDAKGVMGQVIDVGPMTSTLLLISDSKSAVPVRNNRTGERAILVGTNDIEELSLINLPKTSSIHPGDVLVTSGLGRRYPEGYPVGRVEEVKSIPGEDFVKVTVSPVALLNRNRLVLLIWPDSEQEELTAQINERLNAEETTA